MSVDIYGVNLRYVSIGDIIEPDDHNNKVKALWKIYEKIKELDETLRMVEGY